MEEEELLFLGRGDNLSLKEERALGLKKKITELLPALPESLGKFTITFFGQVWLFEPVIHPSTWDVEAEGSGA